MYRYIYRTALLVCVNNHITQKYNRTAKQVSRNTTPRRQSVCPYSYTHHSIHMWDHHQHHRNLAIHHSRLTTRPNTFVPCTRPNSSCPSPKLRKPGSVHIITKSMYIIRIITLSTWCIFISTIEIYVSYNIKVWLIEMSLCDLFLSHRDLSRKITRKLVEITFFKNFTVHYASPP